MNEQKKINISALIGLCCLLLLLFVAGGGEAKPPEA